MPVLVEIPENPNCEAMDAQVFQCRSGARMVAEVLCERGEGLTWCTVTGIAEGGAPCPASACLVDDSGDGACYLVTGGAWGLRLQTAGRSDAWDLDNQAQWGATYFLLSGDGASLKFL